MTAYTKNVKETITKEYLVLRSGYPPPWKPAGFLKTVLITRTIYKRSYCETTHRKFNSYIEDDQSRGEYL